MNIIDLCERRWIPDPLIRIGARHLSRQRLKEDAGLNQTELEKTIQARIEEWSRGPIAVATEAANEQHYEVPPEFFRIVLGKHLKYSSCIWPPGCDDLSQAEQAMLALSAERAGIEDGQNVLDLGCGWGSFTLWAAEQFPDSRFTAMSNSSAQREFIETTARARDLNNIQVITADINDFSPSETFDRIVSVEMLEHVRNHGLLFARIAAWLNPGGRFFAHVFCHRTLCYPYEDRGDGDWMSRHFFTGGMMPSYDLFARCDQHLSVLERWWLDGTHYQKTSESWLSNSDRHRQELIAVLGGGQLGKLRLQRWRMFFIAVAEFFGLHHGEEWGIAHYVFERRV